MKQKNKDCDLHIFNGHDTVFLGKQTTNENAQANKQIWQMSWELNKSGNLK